ncbi:hypothetical protein K2X05_09140 [bacterium]|nr:hypothetical protein [bacterium]
MHNLSQEVLKSSLWVVDAKADDPWLVYFNWLTQFQLPTDMSEGTVLYIDKKHLLADQLLIVDFDRIDSERFSQIWKSLGSPSTTFFNNSRDLKSYNLDARKFLFVTDEA